MHFGTPFDISIGSHGMTPLEPDPPGAVPRAGRNKTCPGNQPEKINRRLVHEKKQPLPSLPALGNEENPQKIFHAPPARFPSLRLPGLRGQASSLAGDFHHTARPETPGAFRLSRRPPLAGPLYGLSPDSLNFRQRLHLLLSSWPPGAGAVPRPRKDNTESDKGCWQMRSKPAAPGGTPG